LLKLRKVEVAGFKSFCERTVVTFSGTGTTCIVGPNGCGKSNVVDAISWVLGEQSHKSLRAERMADCIFNGTTKRPPMGLAEVTLTMEDPELAEAARFVLESTSSEAAAQAGETANEPGSGPSTVEPVTVPESVELSADGRTPAAPDAAIDSELKSKRRKKATDKPVLASKPGEVVVSRRLYRSGQSEYLINGRPARLRDIQEMFMGVGLGPDSYAIIEQGRIGLILSTKPMERRAIIEEAAGVTKFKTKKRLAEAKLESSQANLLRVNDIIVEVEKQLSSLKRQAAKARRYSEIHQQMRGIVRQMLASKARELDAEAERIAQRLEELTAKEAQHAQGIQRKEDEQDVLNRRVYELDAEIRQNQNHLNLTALEVDRNENRIAFNRQRTEELRGRCSQIAAEVAQAGAQTSEWESRHREQQERLVSLRQASAQMTAAVEGLAGRAGTRASQIREAELRIEALRQSAAQAGENLLHLHGEQKQAEEALLHHTAAAQKLKDSETELLECSIQVGQEANTARLDWETANKRCLALQQKTTELQGRIAELRQQREAATELADTLRDSLVSAQARQATITQILKDRSYTAEAVQKLFAAHERGGGGDFRAVGVLADYAEVEEQHETVIQQYLRDELEYVVVETFEQARAGVSLLREEVGGRATFFVDSLHNLPLSEYEPIAYFHPDQGVISRLDKLVGFRDPLGAAAKQFLPRLRSAYLTDSAAAAEKLARENPQYAFLTPDGTCYQGRMVTGGRPDEAGPLGMKRELRALDAETLQLQQRASETHAALETLVADLQSAEQQVEELTVELREAEHQTLAAKTDRDRTESELARLGVELTRCQNELTHLEREVEAAEQRAEHAKRLLDAAAISRSQAETESARLAEELVVLRGFVESEQNELAAVRAELAALNERVASAETAVGRLQQERAEIERREATLRQQEASIQDESKSLSEQSQNLTQQLEGLRAEKLRLEKRQAALEQEWDAGRTRLAQMEEHLRLGRQELQDLREQRSQVEIERARSESDRNHLRETCVAEVNAQPEDLIATETAFITGEELAAAEANYREMKARIESMGAVNMMALEEYNECEQRFAFLSRERNDLLQSIADTQQAIAELDQVSREKFEQAFTAINGNFSEAFHTIFGGGTAEMRLTEPDSSGDAGIDVVASPPGKRLQNILLLSGGEKAMTALALLIAIFRFQPSPFCILDEVDAPLDEANVGRFTRLVGEMSSQTQFILVTHNRKTMETASVLYGVTMQEPGVSKLVSVRWEGDNLSAPNSDAVVAASAA